MAASCSKHIHKAAQQQPNRVVLHGLHHFESTSSTLNGCRGRRLISANLRLVSSLPTFHISLTLHHQTV